jgi:hypothetical protein
LQPLFFGLQYTGLRFRSVETAYPASEQGHWHVVIGTTEAYHHGRQGQDCENKEYVNPFIDH